MFRTSTVSLLLMVLFSLTSCTQENITPIKIGVNPWPGYEFLFLAEKNGYFQEFKVPIELVEYSSLSDVRRAFDHGDIDGMACSLVEVLQSIHNSGRVATPILIPDYSKGADAIFTKNNIHTIKELKGGRVGVELESLNLFLLGRALEMVGMSIDDVNIVALNQTDMETAMINNQVDAVVSYPPYSSYLQNDPQFQRIFGSEAIPGEIVDVIAIDTQTIKLHKNFIERLYQVWQKTLDYAKKHPDEAYAYFAQRENISAFEFKKNLTELAIISSDQQCGYFGQSGLLKQSLLRTDQVLRSIDSISGPDLTAQFALEDCPVKHAAQHQFISHSLPKHR